MAAGSKRPDFIRHYTEIEEPTGQGELLDLLAPFIGEHHPKDRVAYPLNPERRAAPNN